MIHNKTFVATDCNATENVSGASNEEMTSTGQKFLIVFCSQTERIQLQNLLSLFLKTDDLDTAICMLIGPILDETMTEVANIMAHSDIEELIQIRS